MARLVIAPEADDDSAAIIDDLLTKAGAHVADRYELAFDDVYERLISYPQIGSSRPKLGERVRVCVVRPFLVIYEYEELDDIVIILRIIHGKQDITRRLLKSARF